MFLGIDTSAGQCAAALAGVDGVVLARRVVAMQRGHAEALFPLIEAVLREAVDQYGISTPMISDEDRDMSMAFDTLGRGMHSDTPGHAFVLVDESGTVVWQRDYWLDPSRTMYVKPATLLADLADAAQNT